MSEEAAKPKKPAMTEEERLALCEKLDKELDAFIDGLEKKRYTEGWSEDNWEEEMDKHPFFMKATPEGSEMSPLAEGLAKLKYDPEENTPLELASNYKEDGNFNFKHKNYRMAILGYTEGIKIKCDDLELNASLYNNRAAGHWELKNFRSALLDSEKALTFNPNHIKARLRAAKSAYELAKYDKCLEHTSKLLKQQPGNHEALELSINSKRNKMVQERDQRKKERMEKVSAEYRDSILKAVKDRKIRVLDCKEDDDLDLFKLDPGLPDGENDMVQLKDGILYWPVVFLYPQFKMTDFIKACPENVPLVTQLEQLFPAPWDTANEYNIETVNLYYEGYDLMPYIVDPKMNLVDILKTPNYILKAGTPAFLVVLRGSVFERNFLEGYM